MPWWALFCVSDIPLETINYILEESWDKHAPYSLWLATKDWATATHRDGATKAPVESFASPFIGRDLDSLAAELKAAPPKADLDREVFVVLDARTIEDKTILLCYAQPNGPVDTIRSTAKGCGINLGALGISISWEELVEERDSNIEIHGQDFLDSSEI